MKGFVIDTRGVSRTQIEALISLLGELGFGGVDIWEYALSEGVQNRFCYLGAPNPDGNIDMYSEVVEGLYMLVDYSQALTIIASEFRKTPAARIGFVAQSGELAIVNSPKSVYYGLFAILVFDDGSDCPVWNIVDDNGMLVRAHVAIDVGHVTKLDNVIPY